MPISLTDFPLYWPQFKRPNQMKAHHTVRLIVAAIIIGMGWNTISVGIRAVKAFDRAVADKVEEIAELTEY